MDQAAAHAPRRRAPEGKEWLHEIKYDGYRMRARIDGDKIQMLTRTWIGRLDISAPSKHCAR
jgi:ATP-dependent DNA ligase